MEFSSQLFTAPAIKSNKISSSSFTSRGAGRGAGSSAPKLNVSNISRVAFNTKPKDIELIKAIVNVVEEKPKIVEKIVNVVEEKPKIVEKFFTAPKIKKEETSTSLKLSQNAETIKVPKGMGYGGIRSGPNVDPKYLRKEKTPIEQTLVETNNILVEIQKQLSYDFAMRIAEEKKTIRQIKMAESKRKFAEKEKSLESSKKITSALGGAVNKVTAPFKSVFDKIIEFFSLVLGGILLSAAFKWLSKEENRKKFNEVIDFIVKYWKEITLTLLGIKLFGALYKLGRFGHTLYRISKWFGRNKPPGTGSGGIDCAAIAKCFAGATVTVLTTSNILDWLKNNKLSVAGALGIGLVTAPQTPQTGGAQQQPFKEPFNWQGFADSINNSIATGVILTGAFLLALATGLAGAQAGAAKGGTIGQIPMKKKKCSTCSLGFSQGGSVGGRGSKNVDSVSAMLAPGEEVIKTDSAMLFRPLLKDINDNSGRLWATFSLAVEKLLVVVSRQEELAQDFGDAIQQFDTFIEQEKARKILNTGGGTGGGGGVSKNVDSVSAMLAPGEEVIRTDSAMSLRPLLKDINFVPDSAKSGGMNFIPMVLPTQTSKLPEIPEMQSEANRVNVVSPINILNPYMDVTPELYGISYLY